MKQALLGRYRACKALFVACALSCIASAPAQPGQIPVKPVPEARQRTIKPSDTVPNRPEELTFPPLSFEPPRADGYRCVLRSGPVAYVVQDNELPLVNIVIYVRTGEYDEPAGKCGLAGLTGYLLARGGAAGRTAEQLEERLAFLAAQLSSGVGDTQGRVSLNLLSKDVSEGMSILREVLTAPRFQEDRLALRKQQMIQQMQQRNDESSEVESRESGFLAFGEKFWANQYPTPQTVNSVTREDLLSYHKAWFWPSNFVLAVSGDFQRDKMIADLDRLFQDWPFKGLPAAAVPTNTRFASPGAYILDKDVNQGRVDMMLPGILRSNPDYIRVMVMNDILGGGGFTSRIMNRVRSDEGLAYSAFSRFPGGIYFPLTFTAGFQSKNRTVPYAASIVLEEIKRIASEPVSDVELQTSKQGFIERFPRNFSTKTQVANTFAQDEFTGRYERDPGFWREFRSRVGAVTKDDVLQVAKRYLLPDRLVMLIVGQRDQVLLGYPGHQVELKDLVDGPVVDLPQRDPLTLKPISNQASGHSAEKDHE